MESGHCLLAPYARELIEKLVERLAALQIVKQGLYWHACPNEHGRATENLGIAMYDLAHLHRTGSLSS
jgi:hypothetical protein